MEGIMKTKGWARELIGFLAPRIAIAGVVLALLATRTERPQYEAVDVETDVSIMAASEGVTRPPDGAEVRLVDQDVEPGSSRTGLRGSRER
jgi:hypothetical protein